jgi:deoxyribodipyrimidine photo-lyase
VWFWPGPGGAGVTGSNPRMRRVVVVFTRDLRLHDNPVLDLACGWAAEVIPVFVFDPALRPAAPNRAGFLLDCLTDLRAGLRQRGGDLLIRHGDPVTEAIGLARSHRAEGIILAADVSRYAQRRYQRLAAACQQHRLALHAPDALTVVPPAAIVPSGGDHYRVFTPYWRAWSAYPWRQPLPAPKHVAAPRGADAGMLPGREDLTRGPLAASLPRGGETEARRRVARWLDAGLAGYPDRRDDLAGAATSRLSADLHFGTVSPLELAASAAGVPGGEAYARQLCWRDFYLQVTAAFPDIATRDYRPRRDDWRDDPRSYQAWCAGQTGIPIVDAGMRQLAAEGFMHNRARMLVAYALTKQLRIHWTAGARHFSALLVDGDVASNGGNWQWTAGTGNDTRPGRRFNLLRQAHRFDPDGDYVRRYIPELAAVPGPEVHQPWRLPALRYPRPLAALTSHAA